MILTVAHTPREVYAATYELEFREVLVLFADIRRRERRQRAEQLETEALRIQAAHMIHGARNAEAGGAVSELVKQLRSDAQTLREPEARVARVLSPAQQAFMTGRLLPGV